MLLMYTYHSCANTSSVDLFITIIKWLTEYPLENLVELGLRVLQQCLILFYNIVTKYMFACSRTLIASARNIFLGWTLTATWSDYCKEALNQMFMSPQTWVLTTDLGISVGSILQISVDDVQINASLLNCVWWLKIVVLWFVAMDLQGTGFDKSRSLWMSKHPYNQPTKQYFFPPLWGCLGRAGL